ncbi:3-ketoacyl-CoA thiolase with broad chain length specificity [Massospora cicadina]|nr:3-ketoacyl-CoA thiolase with broad chain length specificity [Massospora cicadina]
MASQRLNLINNHISTPLCQTKIGAKSPNDVVIVAAVRTPITRAKKGGLKDTHIEDMLSAVFKAVIERSGVDPKIIQDIAVGNVLTGTAATMSLPIYTVNRQCSSGLQAVASIASAIQAVCTTERRLSLLPSRMMFKHAAQPLIPCFPMGITSENVSKEFNVAREKQDKMAAESHHKASEAQEKGYFNEEIVPVNTIVMDKEGNAKKTTISQDDGIRKGTTPESLKKLKPAFDENGFTTAGNASQVSDGAAAVLLMRRSKALELKLPIIGKYITSAVVGVPPRIMGVGPAYAIPAVVQKAGIKLSDIDIFEINEAFASQAVYCIEKLGIDMSKVNPKGGAIALGHPLGCTGARQVATLLPELKRQGKKLGCISMCIGTGMGMAGIFERE